MASRLQSETGPTEPYPGLRPFAPNEDLIFFGRDQLINELLIKLRDHRFVAVVGTSGSGKSSLVRTGLINKLHAGLFYSAGPNWKVAEMRPRDNPLRELAAALIGSNAVWSDRRKDERGDAESASGSVADLYSGFRNGRLSLTELAADEEYDGGFRLLTTTPVAKAMNLQVIVDQFEEIFRYRREGKIDDAEKFVAMLLEAAASKDVRVHVVLTMRSDFIGDCALFADLPQALNKGQFLVRPLNRTERALAIEEPPKIFNGRVEPGLTNRIQNDWEQNRFRLERNVTDGPIPDQLPLMQHALMRVWHEAGNDRKKAQKNAAHDVADQNDESSSPLRLSTAIYERVGRLDDALNRHAGEVFAEIREKSDRLARVTEIMFRLLTERTESQRDIRRPTKITTVMEVADATLEEVREVVRAFRRRDRSFLVPAIPHSGSDHPAAADGTPSSSDLEDEAKDLTEETFLDISHESLIRQWMTLNNWVEDERAEVDRYREIEASARAWNNGENPRAVLGGYGYEQACKWRSDKSHNVAWVEHNIIKERTEGGKSSRELAQENFGRVSDFLAACDSAARRQNLKKLAIAVVLVALPIVVVIAWLFYQKSVAQQNLARFEREQNELNRAQLLKKEKERNQALLVREIGRLAKSRTDVRYLLSLEALERGKKIGREAGAQDALSRVLSDKLIDESFSIPSPPTIGHRYDVSTVAESRDQKTLVSVDEKGNVIRWNLASGEALEPARHIEHWTGRNTENMSYSGKYIVVGGSYPLRLVDTSTGSTIREIPAPNEKELRRLGAKAHTAGIRAVAYSPDGNLLASGGYDKSIIIRDAKTGEFLRRLNADNQSVYSLAFDPTGTVLASAGYGGTVILWDAKTGNERRRLTGHTGSVYALAFDPTGKYIATGSSRGKIILWRASDGKVVRSFSGGRSSVYAVAFHPSRHLLVSAGSDKEIRLWNIGGNSSGKQDVSDVLKGHTRTVNSIAFSPTGARLVSVGSGGQIKVWDVDKRKLAAQQPTSKSLPNLYSVAWAGSYLVAAGSRGEVFLWRSNGGKFALINHRAPFKAYIASIAVDPVHQILATGDNKQLASLSLPGLVQQTGKVWEVQDIRRRQLKPLLVAFGPNDRLLAVTDNHQTVRLYDIEEAAWRKEVFGSGGDSEAASSRNTSKITSLGFSPDRPILAVGTSQGVIRLWNFGTDRKAVSIGPPGTSSAASSSERSRNKAVRKLIVGKGGVVAAAYEDREVRIWRQRKLKDASPGTEAPKDGQFGSAIGTKETAKEDGKYFPVALEGGHGTVNAMAFDAEGKHLAVNAINNSIAVWRLFGNDSQGTGLEKPVKVASLENGHTEPVTSLRFGGRDKVLYSGANDHTIVAWDWADTGRPLNTYAYHKGSVANLSWGSHAGGKSEMVVLGPTYFRIRTGANISPIEKTILVKGGYLFDAVFALDGKTFFVSQGNDIEARSLSTGKLLRVFKGHRERVTGLALSPDGRILASGSEDDTVKFWNADTGTLIRTARGHKSIVVRLRFSPDGRLLASSSFDDSIILWDTKSGEQLKRLEGHRNNVWDVAFTPDGKSLVSADQGGTVIIWDMDTFQQKEMLKGERASFRAVAVSPDGKTVAAAGLTGNMFFWKTGNGEPAGTLELNEDLRVNGLEYLSNSRLLSAMENGRFAIWDTENKHLIEGNELSDSGRRIWNVRRDRKSGKVVFVSSRNDVYISRVDRLKVSDVVPRSRLGQVYRHLAVSPDGGKIATAAGKDRSSIIVWDSGTGKLLAGPLDARGSPVVSAGFSPDGAKLATGDRKGTILIWDLSKKNASPITLSGTPQMPAGPIVFTHSGKHVVVGGKDGVVRMWESNGIKREPVKRIAVRSTKISAIAASPAEEYRIAAGGDDGTIRIWNLQIPESERHKLELTENNWKIFALRFSPDGKKLVSASGDRSLILWQVENGEKLGVLSASKTKADIPVDVAFSSDGKKVASVSLDNNVRIWDIDLTSWKRKACKELGKDTRLSAAELDEFIAPMFDDVVQRDLCANL